MTSEMTERHAQLEAQRLLLLQLYKQLFLADPDLRNQLAKDLLRDVDPLPHSGEHLCSVPPQEIIAVKAELSTFFANVEKMVEQVREHQPQ